MSDRFDAWEAGHFVQLLIKAKEAQHLAREVLKSRRKNGQGGQADTKGRRAKLQVSNEDYNKAVAALTSEMAVLSPTDEQK